MTELSFGPLLSDTQTLFRFWAPLHDRIAIRVDNDEPRAMDAAGNGWFHHEQAGRAVGSRYKFVLPDGLEVPDPASRFQPDDAHGPSEVVDLDAFQWKVTGWNGRPWEEIVLYELHIGTFTSEGTFLAAIERLDHLKALGVTAIQIMPVSDFPGRYGWGYDGVLPYAPDSSYGRPEDLMALVDAAHERGICVFLDVVYNHFGPDANYLPAYAPIFTEHHKTPWGNGINYDGDRSGPVREFAIQNAIYWIDRFKLDGLRLDAVHAIKDDSSEHLLHELARRVREAAGSRRVHLIVENEDNNSDLLARASDGTAPLYTAQWNDDIHHVLHIAGTGETFGYYGDYANDPSNIGRALAEGFVFQGEAMSYRGESRGKSTENLPATAFISFIQNHDQIGNRAHGDRIVGAQPVETVKALAAIYLLSPQIPMLFMGEEWLATEPFPYFCDFDEDLNEKVRKGRREELSRLPGFDAHDLLDPTARSTFESAKLDWSRLSEAASSAMLSFYRSLLDVRHREIVPLLGGAPLKPGSHRSNGNVLSVDWELARHQFLHLTANLGDAVAAPLPQNANSTKLFSLRVDANGDLGPWSVIWSKSTL